jgi:hypothetical protein
MTREQVILFRFTDMDSDGSPDHNNNPCVGDTAR